VLCTLLHLHGHIGVVFEVPAQPHRWEVAPAELLNEEVTVLEDLSHVDWVVST
jgi:hypothetical protein